MKPRRVRRYPDDPDCPAKAPRSPAKKSGDKVTLSLKSVTFCYLALAPQKISYFAFPNSNASCTICSAFGPSSLLMMQLIRISLVVMF